MKKTNEDSYLSCRLRKILTLLLVTFFILSIFPTRSYAETEQLFNRGDVVVFGHYEQNNSNYNGTEPIRWVVLDLMGDYLYVISESILDVKPYDTMSREVTWENCSLRAWLNGEFMYAAFSTAEQNALVKSELPNERNPKWGTEGGNATYDKVFLLSIKIAEYYYGDSADCKSALTPYAQTQGATKIEENGIQYGAWWLRSPGSSQLYAAYMNWFGGVGYDYRGALVNSEDIGVRPVIAIDITQITNSNGFLEANVEDSGNGTYNPEEMYSACWDTQQEFIDALCAHSWQYSYTVDIPSDVEGPNNASFGYYDGYEIAITFMLYGTIVEQFGSTGGGSPAIYTYKYYVEDDIAYVLVSDNLEYNGDFYSWWNAFYINTYGDLVCRNVLSNSKTSFTYGNGDVFKSAAGGIEF